MSGALRGVGDCWIPTLICLGGICVIRVLWIMFAVPVKPDIQTIMFSYPLTWTVTSVLFVGYYTWFSKISRRRTDRKPVVMQGTAGAHHWKRAPDENPVWLLLLSEGILRYVLGYLPPGNGWPCIRGKEVFYHFPSPGYGCVQFFWSNNRDFFLFPDVFLYFPVFSVKNSLSQKIAILYFVKTISGDSGSVFKFLRYRHPLCHKAFRSRISIEVSLLRNLLIFFETMDGSRCICLSPFISICLYSNKIKNKKQVITVHLLPCKAFLCCFRVTNPR